jgi:hypothetical protein
LKGVFCLPKAFDSMSLEFYKAYVAYNDITRGTKFAFNQDCVKKTINKDYWFAHDKASDDDESKFGLYLFLGIAIGAVFVIAILLLVIYFKRKGEDDEETEGNTKLTP